MKFFADLSRNSTIPQVTKIDILNKEFITGHQENFTQENQSFLDEFEAVLRRQSINSFHYWSRQFCRNAFISLRYQGKRITWNQLSMFDAEAGIGPKYFPTDLVHAAF